MKNSISAVINGKPVQCSVEPRTSLADLLREELRLTATHLGCEQGVCGACTVLIDGQSARACITLAVSIDGSEIRTLEGLEKDALMLVLKSAFHDKHGLQCGFCTPGMLMAAQDLLKQCTAPDREQIREHLSGNYCRCTGYQAIIDAVETTARGRVERRR